MPNHVHFLFSIRNFLVETRCDASLQLNSIEFPNIHSHRNHPDFYKEINIKSNQVIPSAIRAYKQSVKRICNQQNLFFAWQSGYFDEIINNKTRLIVIKNYIKNNPKN